MATDLTAVRAELDRYERQIGGYLRFDDEFHSTGLYLASHWDRDGIQQWVMRARDPSILLRWVRQYVGDLMPVQKVAAE